MLSYRTYITALVIVLLIGMAAAQNITGTISGTVKDPSGALISGATVVVTNTDRNAVVRTLNTDATGSYSVPMLSIGHYSVSVTAPKFSQSTTKDIVLNIDDRLTINFVLQVGPTESAVTVEANPLQVELMSATSAGLVTGTQLRELSLNNRNYEQLLILQPGVSYGGGDQLYVGVMNPNGEDNSVSFSINGARDNANNWTIDGADNVDRGSNSTLLNYPSVDSIEEFKVLRGTYDPEFGRAAGGQINVVTKSGTSKFHGTLYEFFRNDVLNANEFFNKHWEPTADNPWLKRQPMRYNNFGGTIGGPIYIPGHYNTKRNKSFFFYSEELRRFITSATSAPAVVPTADERLGRFANPVCVPSGEGCVLTDHIDPSTWNPAATAYVKDVFSKLALPQVDHFLISPLRNVYNYRQEVIKVDHVFNDKLSVFGRWMNDSIPTEEPTGLWTGLNVPGIATTSTNSPGKNFMVRATATFSSKFLLDAGYAYSYGAIVSRNIGLASTANSPDVVQAIKLPYASTLGRIPAVGFAGGEWFGGFGNYDDFNRNHNWFGNATRIIGRHSIKFGITVHKYNKNENAGGNNTGDFWFGPSGQPEGTSEFEQAWANFLLGNVETFSQDSKDTVADVHQNTIEAYVQDEFRVRPNLTLTFGVRYSLFRQPTDGNGRLTNFDPNRYDPAKAPVIDAEGYIVPDANPNYDPLNGIIIGGKNSPYGTAVSSQTNRNFAPRLGIAWDPFGKGKTSVRAGYGIFYDASTVGYVEDNAWTNPPFVFGTTYTNTRFDNPKVGELDTSMPAPYLRIAGVDWHTPYTQQWSLDIQHEFSKSLLADVGYYGNKGTHLLGGIDLNQVRPGVGYAADLVPPTGVSGDATGTLNQVRPFKGYGYMNAVEPWFKSNYHSLQASLQKRFSGASLISIAYTFSKTMTDSPGDRWNAPQNTYDIAANYGPSPLDRKHIFTANFVYEFPWLRKQQGFKGHVLGGWELSGIINYNSGHPFTVTSDAWTDHGGLGILASGWNSLLPDMIGNPNSGPKTLTQWFTTSAFADVPDGAYRVGNARRGAVRGPGFGRWDLSMFKNTKLTERVNVQFRAEAFNVWNHTNYSGVETALGAANFGQVTSTRMPRNIQFGLKMIF